MTEENNKEIFLKNVKLLAEEKLPMQVDIKYVPDVAMQFNSCDEAQKFCNEYAYMELYLYPCSRNLSDHQQEGNNEVNKVTLRCNKCGNVTEKQQDQLR